MAKIRKTYEYCVILQVFNVSEFLIIQKFELIIALFCIFTSIAFLYFTCFTPIALPYFICFTPIALPYFTYFGTFPLKCDYSCINHICTKFV